ncbi:hypothetical protein D039_0530A, partial [Vibrio parahaemolyticus EKP-028]
MIYR